MRFWSDYPVARKAWDETKGSDAPVSDLRHLVEEASEQQLRSSLLSLAESSPSLTGVLRICLAPEITAADCSVLQREIIDLLERKIDTWNRLSVNQEDLLWEIDRILEEKCGLLLRRGATAQALDLSLFLYKELLSRNIPRKLCHYMDEDACHRLNGLLQRFWTKLLNSCEGEEKFHAVAGLDWFCYSIRGSDRDAMPTMEKFFDRTINREDRREGMLLEAQWLRAQVKRDAEDPKALHQDRKDLGRIYGRLEDRPHQCAVLVDDFCADELRSAYLFREIREVCPPEEWPGYRDRMMRAAEDDLVLSCQLHSIEGHYDLVWEQVFGAGKDEFHSTEERASATIFGAEGLMRTHDPYQLWGLYRQFIKEMHEAPRGEEVNAWLYFCICHLAEEQKRRSTAASEESGKEDSEDAGGGRR